MIDIDVIFKHVEELNLTDKEAIKLIKDNSSFDLIKDSGHYRPKLEYMLCIDNTYNSIWNLTDKDLSKFINDISKGMRAIVDIDFNTSIDITKDGLPLETWISIVEKELHWRELTSNCNIDK